MIEIAPCTVKAATAKVREWHRHLPDIQGGSSNTKVGRVMASQAMRPKRSYRDLHCAEEAAHAETKRNLARANDLVETFREFLNAEQLEAKFVAFMLSRHANKSAQ